MKELILFLLFLSSISMEIFLGSLAVLSFQTLAPTKAIRPLEESLKSTLGVLFIIPLLLLFVFLGRGLIYPWTEITALPAGFPQTYFGNLFFVARTVFYFILWIFLALQARKGKIRYSGLALVILLLTATFWSMDWLMSLDKNFKSTAFGFVFILSSLLLAYGFVVARLKKSPSYQELQDINNIHFALIGSWTYVTFVQFLIIWSGNLSAESLWYVKRLHSSGAFVIIFIVLFQSVVPLFLLLVRRWKASLKFTRSLAFLTVFCQLMFLFWILSGGLK